MPQESCYPITRWRRRKEVRPAEILDAALGLFVERGFKATKMEDIARAAGVTKGTPYLYFENKEEIFKAVVRDNLVTRLAGFAELAEHYDGSSAELLHLMIRRWWDEVGSSPLAGICKLMIAEATNFPELARFYHQEVILPSHRMLRQVLQRGMDSGEFAPMAQIDAIADTLVAPLLNTMTWMYSFGRVVDSGRQHDLPPPDFLEISLRLMLDGLRRRD